MVLIGSSSAFSKDKVPALFETQAEAEEAAKKFNCIGAHKMGKKWMPCKSHKVHEKHKKDTDHGYHNHDH